MEGLQCTLQVCAAAAVTKTRLEGLLANAMPRFVLLTPRVSRDARLEYFRIASVTVF